MNELESDISVVRAVELAGSTSSNLSGPVISTACPSCGQDLMVRAGSMICTSHHACGFRRGGALDYLAYASGGYRQAVKKAFPDLPDNQSRMLTEDLYSWRELQEFLMTVDSRKEDGDPERVSQILVTDKAGLLTEGNPLGFIFFTSRETGLLFEKLSNLGVVCPPGMRGPVVVHPFWSAPHKIGSLEVFVNMGRAAYMLNFSNTRWLFSGLHRFHLEPARLVVHPSSHQMIEGHRQTGGTLTSDRHTQVLVNYGADLPGWDENLVFCGTPRQWMECFPKWSALPRFESAGFRSSDGQIINLVEAVRDLLKEAESSLLFSLDAINPALRVLAGMTLSEKASSQILDEVFTELGVSAYADAEETLMQRLILRTAKGSVYSGPKGYFKKYRGDTQYITNFTLEMDEVVGFSTGGEVIIRGRARVGNYEFNLSFPGTCLDSPSKLEKELQSWQILSQVKKEDSDFATINDPRGFKLVSRHLKNQMASTPRSRGTRLLGWSKRRDEFHFPGFIVRKGDSILATYVPADDTDIHFFSSRPLPDFDLCRHLKNDPLRNLLAACVGSTSRALQGQSGACLKYQNTRINRHILGLLFKVLGQDDLTHLTSVLPRNIHVVDGFPLLFRGPSEHQVDQSKLSGACLLTTGQDLSGTEEDDAVLAGELLMQSLYEMSKASTSGEDVSIQEHRSVSKVSRVMKEGAEILGRLRGETWKISDNSYRYLDLLMEERKQMIEEAAKTADSDKFMLPPDITEGVADPSDIAIEIGSLCKSVFLRDNGEILVPSMVFANLFETYHGTPLGLQVDNF